MAEMIRSVVVRDSCCLVLLAATLCGCGGASSPAQVKVMPPEPITVTPARLAGPPVYTEVRSGDTLESVARRVAGDDWVVWRDALMAELDPRRLRPGTVFDGSCNSCGELVYLRVGLDMRTELFLERVDEEISSQRVQRPIEHETIRLEGVVESSLFAAVEEAGGHPELAVLLAEIYQWDVDFLRDLRKGDSFVVIADRQSVDGEHFGYGTIYAASFDNDGRRLTAIAYPDDNGRVGYYDPEGRTMRKQFLRSPLEFSRITSRFSLRRYHPVHKRRMPHYGVDYAAPPGTPVRATADGVVTLAGMNGGAGRMVTLRHTNGFETSYLHLRGYGRGVRRGTRVRQGQVIGYVGSSGWATGPHLDYRVKLNGSYINPLRLASPPVEPLGEERRQQFLVHAMAVLGDLEPAPNAGEGPC